MAKFASYLAFAGSIFALIVGAAVPARAGCNNDGASVSGCIASEPASLEFAAQTKRPRVTIYRRDVYPGPNAVRQCRSWLVKEYRVSGPVIVPQMRCWWE